jgi:ribose transport system permease protein
MSEQPSIGTGQRVIRSIVSSQEFGILLVLVGMVVVVGIVNPDFISFASFTNIGQRAAWYGILAIGIVFLLSMGEIDLSVGAIYAFVINIAAIMMADFGLDPWLAAAGGMAFGIGLGLINGVLANGLGVPVIIVTLGTFSAYRGLSFIASGGRFVYGLPRDDPFFQIVGSAPFGLPLVVWVFAIAAVVFHVVYRYTRFGFATRAIGANKRAAALSGIAVDRHRLLVLGLMGFLCGLSGIMTLGFFASADPNLGTGYELLAIAAAIIGGTALSGGRGSVIGAMLGAILIALIGSAITQFGVRADYSIFVTGVLITVAVAVDSLVRRRQRRRVSLQFERADGEEAA